MQAIGRIGAGTGAAARRRSDAAIGAAEPAAAQPGRALARIEGAAASERTRLSRRPNAAFLAQLIATRQQAPQTRVRRRAEPAEAIAIYGETIKRAPADIGGIVARST